MEDAERQGGEFVTINRYRDLSEAIVAKSLLESAGIAAWIRDENVARLEWQYSNLLGGIRLQVSARNEEAAREALRQPIPETIAFDQQENFEQPKCPACGSIDITYEGASRRAALVSVSLLSVPLPRGGTSWTCHACGARWRDTEDEAPHGERASRTTEQTGEESGFLQRLGYGVLPIALTLVLLDAGLRVRAAFWPALALGILVLWLGRDWMAATLVTRSLGISLAIVVLILPVLVTAWVVTGVSPIAALVFCLAIPVLLWDLFVSQPRKGRFSRARAERRGLP
jgi:Putative prokaryotic signal transducing protein